MIIFSKKFKSQYQELEKETNQERKEKIGLGKRIEISVNGEFQVWDIVPTGESSILDKKISLDSPLIRLILGLKTGKEVKGTIGAREVSVKIRNVYKTLKR